MCLDVKPIDRLVVPPQNFPSSRSRLVTSSYVVPCEPFAPVPQISASVHRSALVEHPNNEPNSHDSSVFSSSLTVSTWKHGTLHLELTVTVVREVSAFDAVDGGRLGGRKIGGMVRFA